MAFEEQYMLRAIELAKKGIGAVNPNPLVGAVIVKDGRIIGEGYHAKYGNLHAERDAFSKLTESAEGAEMYVTLEPCCHYGKQPPCVEAIVEHKVKCVYVGSDDPNEMVSGKGYEYLRNHGIEVNTHCLKSECDALNSVFFHYITHKTPYVMLKYAMTMDGKIATYSGKSQWISGEESRALVQKFRNEYVGIMVGIGTVLADNPMLTCRLEGGRNPIRIVADTRLQIPEDAKLVTTAKEVPTIVACGVGYYENHKTSKVARLEKLGVQVLSLPMEDNHIDLKSLMVKLGEMKIDGIMLEGGGTLNDSMLAKDLVQEIRIFLAPKIFGGATAKTPVAGMGVEAPEFAYHFTLKEMKNIGEDVYLRYMRG